MAFPAIASAQVSSPNGKVVWDELNNEGRINGFAVKYNNGANATELMKIPSFGLLTKDGEIGRASCRERV